MNATAQPPKAEYIEYGEKREEHEGPFILVPDNDGHWYVIPARNEHEWSWFMITEDGPEILEVPTFAFRVDGPSHVKFLTFKVC